MRPRTPCKTFRRRRAIGRLSLAISLAAVPVSAGFGQDDIVAPAQAERRAPTVIVLTSVPRPLREGTRLIEAAGEIARRPDQNGFVFRAAVPSTGTEDHQHELALLPSTRLEEIARIMEGLDRQRMSFEITGRVYLYGGKNYLLVQQAIQRDAAAPPETEARPADDVDADPPVTDEDSAASRRLETDQIIADLEDSLGPVPTVARDLVDPAANGAVDSSSYREGQMLMQRRGRPMRLPDGMWRIVFDADASGLADPPMLILPCQLLERLQELGQREASDRAVRISGEVYTYRGRAYLMPLSYHEASGRSRLGG